MSRKILMSFLSLALASCSALPSNQSYVSGTASFDQVNTLAVSQYEKEMLAKSLANPYANSVADVDNSYKSLSIAKENAKFGVKSTVVSDERAVIVKVGAVSYTLSESFMKKLRDFTVTATALGYDKVADPLLVVAPATVAGGAELTSSAFARLSAPNGVALGADINSPGVSGTASSYTSAYTLTASEAAFVALMKTYKSVSMPDYFGTDDTTTANTPASAAVPPAPILRKDGLFFIINTTGISDNFYRAVNTALTTPTVGVLDATEITALNITPIVHGTSPAAVPTVAEKAFLTSIVNLNPYAQGVLLLSGNNIVSNDISLYYGDAENPSTQFTTTSFGATLALSDPKALLLANYGKLSRVNTTQPATTNKLPLSTTNYSGAAAVVATQILTDPAGDPLATVYTAAGGTPSGGLGSVNGPALTGNSITTYVYSDLHDVERAVHMKFAPLGTPIAPITTATATTLNTSPSIATLSFNSLAAPAAAVPPAAPASTAVLSTEYGTLGAALVATGGGISLTKIGKTTAATYKNRTGVLAYITAALATLPTAKIPAFVVPCTRSATGAITLSPTGTHYVVITAIPNATVLGTYDFFIVDTGYNGASGLGYSFLGNSGATATSPLNSVVAGLYNYTGTLVAVTH